MNLLRKFLSRFNLFNSRPVNQLEVSGGEDLDARAQEAAKLDTAKSRQDRKKLKEQIAKDVNRRSFLVEDEEIAGVYEVDFKGDEKAERKYGLKNLFDDKYLEVSFGHDSASHPDLRGQTVTVSRGRGGNYNIIGTKTRVSIHTGDLVEPLVSEPDIVIAKREEDELIAAQSPMLQILDKTVDEGGINQEAVAVARRPRKRPKKRVKKAELYAKLTEDGPLSPEAEFAFQESYRGKEGSKDAIAEVIKKKKLKRKLTDPATWATIHEELMKNTALAKYQKGYNEALAKAEPKEEEKPGEKELASFQETLKKARAARDEVAIAEAKEGMLEIMGAMDATGTKELTDARIKLAEAEAINDRVTIAQTKLDMLDIQGAMGIEVEQDEFDAVEGEMAVARLAEAEIPPAGGALDLDSDSFIAGLKIDQLNLIGEVHERVKDKDKALDVLAGLIDGDKTRLADFFRKAEEHKNAIASIGPGRIISSAPSAPAPSAPETPGEEATRLEDFAADLKVDLDVAEDNAAAAREDYDRALYNAEVNGDESEDTQMELARLEEQAKHAEEEAERLTGDFDVAENEAIAARGVAEEAEG